MSTHRSSESLQFSNLGRREVVAEFDGGRMTSDAGAMLLGEVNARCGLISRLAECFTDYRDPSRVEFPVDHLLAQRIFGLCLGYAECARLTGIGQRVRVPRGEGLATHSHREPCVCHREVAGEASVAAQTGRANEHRNALIWNDETFPQVEVHAPEPPWRGEGRFHGVKDPGHVCTSSVGTWEVSEPPRSRARPHREGGTP